MIRIVHLPHCAVASSWMPISTRAISDKEFLVGTVSLRPVAVKGPGRVAGKGHDVFVVDTGFTAGCLVKVVIIFSIFCQRTLIFLSFDFINETWFKIWCKIQFTIKTWCSFRKSAAYRVVAPSSGRGKGHAGQNNVILVISCQARKPSASSVDLALASVVAQAIYLAAVELENEQMQLISFQEYSQFQFYPS